VVASGASPWCRKPSESYFVSSFSEPPEGAIGFCAPRVNRPLRGLGKKKGEWSGFAYHGLAPEATHNRPLRGL
jgi:hypothetical protein